MPFVTAEDVAHKTFDYIVIGGGTAGLPAAVRLSEEPSVSILVLEAGRVENLGDFKIDVPAQFGHALRNPLYDWIFTTAKQKNLNNNSVFWSRGKGLGGTSAVNFSFWSKPPATDIDNFEKLGNPGWNWAEYKKYSNKSECAHLPGKEQTDLYPQTFTDESCGKSGPVQVVIPPHLYKEDSMFQETMVRRGLKSIKDPYGGDITGTWIGASSLDPKTWTRSYAATAYLLPNIHRPNLNVLTSALVSRILFKEAKGNEDRVAKAVEFIYGGKTYAVNVKKEVILSAGGIKSPHILELSGIGQPEVLSEIGVDVVVDLPGVGENVQEHIMISTPFELPPGHESLDLLLDPVYAAKAKELHALGQGLYRSGIASAAFFTLSATGYEGTSSLIDTLEAEINAKAKADELPPGLEAQLRIQVSALRDDTIPDCEVILCPNYFFFNAPQEKDKCYVTPLICLNHPVSRGTIHAESKDATIPPVCDPHYFESNIDLEIMLQMVKFVRSLKEVEPWKSGTVKEVFPGPDCVTDDDLRGFIKENLISICHTAGSCSMLPRDKRGVVDPNLKVYGTTNLRVADISIIPLHIAAHTQATAFMIGEKVADVVKAENSETL
ncbi:GMC oxidoreductase [Gymnopilus junonius]|uniref:pyranose dehydrogenase (acceptor) n=1 Tax=Gymnopilus junonius TaxID=109634 RepID=A0A9P5N9G0_GYMJU|nr:GMC oxidoreductase [Gymnopilus junonius]